MIDGRVILPEDKPYQSQSSSGPFRFFRVRDKHIDVHKIGTNLKYDEKPYSKSKPLSETLYIAIII